MKKKKHPQQRKGIIVKGNDHAYKTGKIKPRWEDLRPVIDAFGSAIHTLGSKIIDLNNNPTIIRNLGEDRNYYIGAFRTFSDDMLVFGERYKKLKNLVMLRKGRIKTLEDSLLMHEYAEEVESFHNALDIIMMSTMATFGDIVDRVVGRISDGVEAEQVSVVKENLTNKDEGVKDVG